MIYGFQVLPLLTRRQHDMEVHLHLLDQTYDRQFRDDIAILNELTEYTLGAVKQWDFHSTSVKNQQLGIRKQLGDMTAKQTETQQV